VCVPVVVVVVAVFVEIINQFLVIGYQQAIL
jgi:hypothetical protein